ncbi:MAG: PIN domain-containing protein [Armatimonadetes bacterium]|nr:PIN domain-containing protein [Armatimonadota bacterium]
MPTEPPTQAIDANVIVRYIIGDDPERANKALAIFTAMVEGELVLECDPVNLAEVFWVLSSFYEVPTNEIVERLIPILQHEGFQMSDKELYLRALALCADGLVEFTDACACATALEKCDGRLLSFDRKLSRVPGIRRSEAVAPS